MPLVAAKLAEVGQLLGYLRDSFERLRADAYPNLAERLRLRLEQLDAVGRDAVALEAAFDGYLPPTDPALDTWPQLFARLRSLTSGVQSVRAVELPAYLSGLPEEAFFAAIFEALHREIGLIDVYPVVSLHQPHWFAVLKVQMTHPLYLVPDSLAAHPGELPLLFHEIGHVLFRLWAPDLPQHTFDVLGDTYQRKLGEILLITDQHVRNDMLSALNAWGALVPNQLEELVCDVVGALLGGPAFAVTLAVGLFITDTAPFDYAQSGLYPPLDCRLRIGGIVLRRQGLDDRRLAEIEEGWARVCAIPGTTPPRFYRWLYDDTLLEDMVAAVAVFLLGKGVQLYRAGCGGLRERLDEGATARLADAATYRSWATAFAAALRRDYSSSQSSSLPPSSGSSA